MTTKLKIDLVQGILEVEGSETFVKAIYRDFKVQFLGEDAVEEEMAVDPALDSEAILAIVTPILEEREKAIIALIADLRNQMEEMMVGESEVEVEATDNKTKMSVQAKFSAVSKFLNLNNQ